MDNIFSPHWHQVAKLIPTLANHVEVSQHKYDGTNWFVYLDLVSGRTHRFSSSAHYVISMMNGSSTVHQIWLGANDEFGDDAPTQHEFIILLAKLHNANILKTNIRPDINELLNRCLSKNRSERKKRYSNPLSLRFPLFDPDSQLNNITPVFKFVFHQFAFILSILFFFTAAVKTNSHWTELSTYAIENALAPNNLIMLWVLYPIVKYFHEMGHAIAAKHWGSEIHEMGILFLLFTPVPYVDASSTNFLKNKFHRLGVAAAGIYVELFLSACALFVWLNVESGLVQQIAFNVMLIGGVSTLLFNGNPLFRYDGYYMLSDWADIPNLATRANKYIGNRISLYIFDIKNSNDIEGSAREKRWFVFYGLSAFSYRIFILSLIIIFLLDHYFFIGVALAIWVALVQIIFPLFKQIGFLYQNSRTLGKKIRSGLILTAMSSVIYGFVVFIPIPYTTITEGVVWLQDDAFIRAEQSGFVDKLYDISNKKVNQGDTIAILSDPTLASDFQLVKANIRQLNLEYQSLWGLDLGKRDIIKEKIRSAESELEFLSDKLNALSIKSPFDGVLVFKHTVDIRGKFLNKGDIIAYVYKTDKLSARTLLSEEDIDLVKSSESISIRPIYNINQVVKATLDHIEPTAKQHVSSPVLSVEGGGKIALDPAEKQSGKTLNNYFELALSLSDDISIPYIGSRLYIKFDHGSQALIHRLKRSLRQLLMDHFNE